MRCLMVFVFILSETITRLETSTTGNNKLFLQFKGFDTVCHCKDAEINF